MEQMEHSECGLASVAMMANYFDGNVTLTKLRNDFGVPIGGYTVLQLKKILNFLEFQTRAIKISMISDLNDFKDPFITIINGSHFVVVEKVKRNAVIVVDPGKGRVTYSKDDFNDIFSGILLFIVNKVPRNIQLFRLKSQIVVFLKKSKLLFLAAFLFILILQICNIFIPIIIRDIVNKFSNINEDTFFIVVLGIIIFFTTYYLLSLTKTIVISKLQRSFDYNLLSGTLTHLLKLPLHFFINRNSGELIFRINSNTVVRRLVTDTLLNSIIDFIFLIVYFLVMLQFNITLSLITLIVCVLIFLLSIVYTKKVNRLNQKQIIIDSTGQNIITEIVQNISSIKAIGAENQFYSKWKNNFEKQLFFEKKNNVYNAILLNMIVSLQLFYPIIVIMVGARMISYELTTIGDVMAFISIGSSFLVPLSSLSTSINSLSLIKEYIQKLLDIMESKIEPTLISYRNSTLNGRILMKSVNFKYDYFSENILNEVNLSVEYGEKIAIIGESGSGKSTLLKLISGLYTPTEGEITIDNLKLSELSKTDLKENMGIVLQENLLFNASLRENILLGREIMDDEIFRVAKEIGLNSFINQNPLGLDTIVSEGGKNFSGGQRQKISICRAIVHNPNIIILDEPTSSLDNLSEKKIMSHLFQTSKTIIVVAHRLSTIEFFDKIIIMNSGQIEAMGSHVELLSSSQTYIDLLTTNI